MELLLTLETAVDYTTDDQAGELQPPTEDDKEVAIESSSVSPVPVAPQMGSNTVTHALSALDVNVMAAAATCPTQTKPSASMFCHHVISHLMHLSLRSQSFTDATPTLSWPQYHQNH